MLLLYGCTEVKENNLVFFSHSVMSDSLQPHGLQHARPPCPSPTPRACSNSCPSSPWCHPTISSSVVHFSSCPQSFPALGAFPMSQPFASSGQSIGASASASILPVNIQGWFLLGWTGWISLLSKDSQDKWYLTFMLFLFTKNSTYLFHFHNDSIKQAGLISYFTNFSQVLAKGLLISQLTSLSAFGIAFLQFCLFLLPVTFVTWVSTQFFPC